MLEYQHVGLVVALEELEVEFNGFLASQDFADSVIDIFRFLRVYEYSKNQLATGYAYRIALRELIPNTFQEVLCSTLYEVKRKLVRQQFVTRNERSN